MFPRSFLNGDLPVNADAIAVIPDGNTGAVISVPGLTPAQAISAIIYDDFSTDAAAGFASPRAASHVGKLVRSADTANRVSINAGALWPNGATVVSYADFGYYYTDDNDAPFARVAGFTTVFKLIGGAVVKVGYSTNTVLANATQFGFLTNNAGTISYSRAGTDVVIGTFSALATYLLAATLRTNGIEFRVKGGDYSEWSVVMVETNWNTTPLVPSLTGSGAMDARLPLVSATKEPSVVGTLATGSHILSQNSPDTTILPAANSGLYLLTLTSVAGAPGNLVEVRTQQADDDNYLLARVQWNGSNYELVTGHVIAGVETLQGSPIATVFGTSGVNRLWIRDVGANHDFYTTGGTTITKRYGTIADANGGANVGTSVRIVGGFTNVNLTAWDYQDATIAVILDRIAA
jgi:hypothetical protein